jgi:hypothetical protein
MISTYFGNITIVLKLPFTRAASTNGLQRYNTLGAGVPPGDGGIGIDGMYSEVGDVAEVGVVDLLLGPRGWRVMERPIELKKDMLYGY